MNAVKTEKVSSIAVCSMKSCEGFLEMIPINNYLVLCYRQTKPFTKIYGSYIISNFNNFEHTNHIIQASKHHSIYG